LLPAPTKLRRIEHMAAMPYAGLPDFLAQLRERPEIAARALEFLTLTATRTTEVLLATWAEIDLTARIWVIPGHRVKGGVAHRVPLTERVAVILEALPRETGNPLVFLSSRGGRPLSPVAMLRVMRAMGVTGTPHGFRSSFRDWCAEQTNFPRELAEAALAHTLKGKAERAYQRGDLLEKRRRMMDAWARYCTSPSRVEGEVCTDGWAKVD
jgi:integrase